MHDFSFIFMELGLVFIGLAVLARLASRIGLSAIPLYLIAGLAFGKGGVWPMDLSKGFIELGAEMGVLLLLFMLGLEYSGQSLKENLRRGAFLGGVDLVLNFLPGFLVGLILGWQPIACLILAGVTYVSSSGLIAKVISELKRSSYPETPAVVSVLVMEDLAMALYLPVVAVLLVGGSPVRLATSVAIAVVAVLIVLTIAIRYGDRISAALAHESDEVILLTTFGAVLLVGGVAHQFQVSPAIGAFLVGIALSGPIAKQSHKLIAPLRDLFAAMFFFFFGLEVNPGSLPPVLPLAIGLAVLTALTKVLTGYWGTMKMEIDTRSRIRAGVSLIARGEFSIVIAGLGSYLQPDLGPLSAAYVLILAVAGPILMHAVK